jgi:hypothetical protein
VGGRKVRRVLKRFWDNKRERERERERDKKLSMSGDHRNFEFFILS